jgi:DNA-directed RNA polymerase subunit beta'
MAREIKALKISIASPQQILNWSFGEVKKPETINYRTHRAEVDGLMDERVFGPTKNYECYCGKYKKIRYKGIVCDQCGVEVTTKRVRRERMGHIKLATSVTHVWFSYGLPNKLSLLLNIPQKKLETVIYYARYIVTDFSEDGKVNALETLGVKLEEAKEQLEEEKKEALLEIGNKLKEENEKLKAETKDKDALSLSLDNLQNKSKKEEARLKSIYVQKEKNLKEKFDVIRSMVEGMKEGTTLSEDEYGQLLEFGIDFFDLGMGAEAIRKLLSKLDLKEVVEDLTEKYKKTKSQLKRRKYIQRLRLLKGMMIAEVDPTWIIMDVVPVLPPDLRPIIQLPGGRFATSDLNDLYRRVINRNNRLKRLIKLGAPEIILRNEKRMLQEAVDALIDNSHRPGNAVLNSREQPYKSLSDMLRGKQGRFRQNLLGKRVDYSARSVIVPGPKMSIYQIGLPKTMALELFKPFVVSEIIKDGFAPNIKSAKLFFDSKTDEVWDLLERVTRKHPVMANRAPTLHKQGIQAFFPILVEGNAIQLHPMVCRGFNADFDGDQMAIHVPLSQKAKEEIIERMFVNSNVLLMADGIPIVNAEKDMALGIYYITEIDEGEGRGSKWFGDVNQALGLYDLGELDIHERIDVIYKGQYITSSVGRLIFNEILPADFRIINERINKKGIAKIASEILDEYGSDEAVQYLDRVKMTGFKFGTKSGISVSLEDFVVSPDKQKFLDEIAQKEEQYTQDFYMGLLTMDEKKRLVQEAWMEGIDKIADVTWKYYLETNNTLVTLNESGATPVSNPLRQISGVKGLILDPMGRIVELPIKSNYKEGLSNVEYFVAARATRKGLADTALKTAESGYLTRRLVDVAQDVIVREDDCGTIEGIYINRSDKRRLAFGDRIKGRTILHDLVDESTGEVILKSGEIVTSKIAEKVDKNENIKSAYIRSVLSCHSPRGLCKACYGYSLGTGKPIEKGIAAGIIAAQAMGEAATQLTLNTKHLGVAGTDITQGLPRVEELFEARTPKAKATLSEISGIVHIRQDKTINRFEVVVASNEKIIKNYTIKDGDDVPFKKGRKVKQSEVLLTRADGKELLAPSDGQVTLDSGKVVFESSTELSKTYLIPFGSAIVVEDKQEIQKGDRLTEGSIDPKELMDILGVEAVQDYIIDNIQDTYGIQGISLDDRHVELVVRQMSRFVIIQEQGDSDYLPGDYVDYIEVENTNKVLEAEGKNKVKVKRQIVGITTASIRTESFLSAASFQEQVRVLTDAALIGKVDELRGLKENVIIGKPVPLGTELSTENDN